MPPAAKQDYISQCNIEASLVTSRLSAAEIDRAAALLRRGELVAFPTETVYGLGGDATNEDAVAAIFSANHGLRHNGILRRCQATQFTKKRI